MHKKFLSNLGFLVILNLAIKLIYIFGIDLQIQNIVKEDAYGSFYAFVKFSFVLNILLDFGIENFNRRELARNDKMLDKYFSNFIILKLILCILFFTVGISGGIASGYSYAEIKILFIILFNEFIRSMILYQRANLGGLHLFRADSIFSVLDRFLLIVVCGALLINKESRENFQIEWLIYSQTGAYLTSFLIASVVVSKKIKKFHFEFNKSLNISIIKKLSPYALLIFLMAVYTHADPFLIERFLPDGKEQSGVYAQSSRILEACANFAFLFPTILLPIFSRMLRNKENIDRILNISLFLIIIPAILAVVSFNVFKKEITAFLYPDAKIISPETFGILMFSLIGLSIGYIYGTLLTANGNLKQLIYISSIGVLVSLTLNIVLIPNLKAYGAAMANVSAQSLTAILQILYARKVFKLKTNFKIMAQFSVLAVILFFGGKWMKYNLELNWQFKFIILLISGFTISIIFIFKDLMLFIRLIKKEKTHIPEQ